MKKILTRGLIIGLIILLISCVGMGIIDMTVFLIVGLLIAILAGISVLIHNRKGG